MILDVMKNNYYIAS